jgi:hypothetical protein
VNIVKERVRREIMMAIAMNKPKYGVKVCGVKTA